MNFQITFTAITTAGRGSVTTDPIPSWGDAMDHLAGMVAAVGVENVVSIHIDRVH